MSSAECVPPSERCAVAVGVERPRLGDTCWEGFSNGTGRGWNAHPAARREPSGLDYSLYKNTKKKQKTANFIIKMEKKKENQPNQTDPIFLSDCKSVYKCTACGCVRGCVIGNVYQHLNYCREIFQLRALLKAHVSWMDISSL